MAMQQSVRSSKKTTNSRSSQRVIDLGGKAFHVFHFDSPPAYVYEYFGDVPTICRLLPDTLDVYPYGHDCYRLIVGASDGMGHTMAAVFDMQVQREPDRIIRIVPVKNGPEIRLKGLTFRGTFQADAIFAPTPTGTSVEYNLEIEMTIPLPGMLGHMPSELLQNMGERGMGYKMSRMISGFTKGIDTGFVKWMNATHAVSS